MPQVRAITDRFNERWIECARIANIVVCAAALIAATPYLTI